MVKILTRVPHPGDGVSLFRGFGPLGQLRTMIDVEFHQCQEFNWPVLSQCDGVYMVRPATDADLSVLRMAQRCSKPVWIDYDDHVLAVPQSNPGHSFYANPKHRENIRCLLKEANYVSVSTLFLKEEFEKIRGRGIHHIPNAFPDHILNWYQEDVPRQKVISWRGSRTHDKDLSLAHDFLIQFQKDMPDWQVYFFGEIDYRTADILIPGSYKIFPYSDVIEYFHTFKKCGSSLHFVPLEDNDFNRSKSNIAWIEATWAGVPCMPIMKGDFNEWAVPGILSSVTREMIDDFSSGLKDQMANSVTGSKAYIMSQLLLSGVNQKRINIIQSMSGRI